VVLRQAILRVRDWLYENFIGVVSSIPYVKAGVGNDVFSTLVYHCPARSKSSQSYIRSAQTLKNSWPNPPQVIRTLSEFLLENERGNDAAKTHCKDTMRKGRNSDEVAIHLQNSRSLRGGDKTVPNTYLKDVANVGPPTMDFSTYAKWRTATDGIDTKTNSKLKIAYIGCTKDNDWWSEVMQGDVTKYDINNKAPIQYLDVTNPKADIGKCHVILSDVYLPKPVSKGIGETCAHDFNQQAKVPGHIWDLQEKSKASVVIMKCFPSRSVESAGGWSIDHLCFERHPDWHMDIYLSGRCHNGEFIAFFSKQAIRRGSFPVSTFDSSRRANWLRYLFGVMKDSNDYRNNSLLLLSTKWRVTPLFPLDRLPKGEVEIVEKELAQQIHIDELKCVEHEDDQVVSDVDEDDNDLSSNVSSINTSSEKDNKKEGEDEENVSDAFEEDDKEDNDESGKQKQNASKAVSPSHTAKNTGSIVNAVSANNIKNRRKREKEKEKKQQQWHKKK